MSDEYIDREVALHGLDANISHLRQVAGENSSLNKAVNLVQYTRDFIAELPAADVVERRRGKWEKDPDMRRWHGHIYDYRCSLCRTLAEKGYYNNHDRLTNYCPTCGADMRGE